MKKVEELLYRKVSKKQKQLRIQMWYFFRLYADFPLIGIEPAILTFRDEYIRLADDTEVPKN
jgi:hypothetical protein